MPMQAERYPITWRFENDGAPGDAGRGLETMLRNVESNLAALTTPNGDDQ